MAVNWSTIFVKLLISIIYFQTLRLLFIYLVMQQ